MDKLGVVSRDQLADGTEIAVIRNDRKRFTATKGGSPVLTIYLDGKEYSSTDMAGDYIRSETGRVIKTRRMDTLAASVRGFIETGKIPSDQQIAEKLAAKEAKRAEMEELTRKRDAEDRIYSAAPELLEALKAASGYLLNAAIFLGTGATTRDAIRTIEDGLRVVNAAIAKATGVEG